MLSKDIRNRSRGAMVGSACLMLSAMPVSLQAADGPEAPSVVMPDGDVTDWDYKITIDRLRPWLEPDSPDNPAGDDDKVFVQALTQGIHDAIPERLTVTSRAKRRILLIARGQNGGMHAPGQAGLILMLREVVKRFDAFDITLWHYPTDAIGSDTLEQFDAVILASVGALSKETEIAFYEERLPAYVRGGGGVMMLHSTALIYDWPYKRELAGPRHPSRQKGPRSWTAESDLLGAGAIKTDRHVHPGNHAAPYPVKVHEPDNPLSAAFMVEPQRREMRMFWTQGPVDYSKRWTPTINAPRELVDECYIWSPNSNSDGSARVLLSVDRQRLAERQAQGGKQVRFPEGTPDFGYAQVWMKAYGEGRVYYSALGHQIAIYTLPCIARGYLDALQYVAGDLQVPDRAEKGTHP